MIAPIFISSSTDINVMIIFILVGWDSSSVRKLIPFNPLTVLTDVLLETLSIVAYKQPITRQEIEAIRGVSCVHAVNKLVDDFPKDFFLSNSDCSNLH